MSDASIPPALDAELRRLAAEAAGQPLTESLGPGSPLAALMGRFVEIALEEELTAHLGSPPGTRAPGSTNVRNGSSRKTLKTSHGPAEIKIPRDRESSFEPKILPKHRTMTADLEARVTAMYAQGMTTRSIQRHVEELYHIQASEMLVTRIVDRLEPELQTWRSRELEATYPILFIDAIHYKVRHASGARRGVHSTAIYTVTGYDEKGQHRILGIYAGSKGETGEAATMWHQVLLDLKERGLHNPLIVTSDGLKGMRKALRAVYPEVVHLPCVVHLMRAALRTVPAGQKKDIARQLKRIYQAATPEAAEQALNDAEDALRARYGSTVTNGFRTAWPNLQQLWRFPAPLRKLVYTTNPVENVHGRMRGVTKNRGVFPSVDSAVRLLTLVADRIDKTNKAGGTRPDWPHIVTALHLIFPGRLPTDWGRR
jgi:transposase-like protein